MARRVDLLSGAAATAGDKASVDVGGTTPFVPGRDAIVHFDAEGATGTAPLYVIDGSDDDTVWVSDLATTVAVGHSSASVKCYRYMRASVTTAAGTAAGTLSVWLEAA